MPGLYIHIPFCKQACHYCDFHFSTTDKQKDVMLEAMLKEMAMRKEEPGGAALTTLYFGGGTPSMIGSAAIKKLMEGVRLHFGLTERAEVTLEANPDDINLHVLDAWKEMGITRLSIGVQSFRDDDLRFMNRAHNAGMAREAVTMAKKAGFENITIDLIYGLPGSDEVSWAFNLETFLSLELPHLSAYALTVEEGTAFHHFIKKGKMPPPRDDDAAAQLLQLMATMEAAGYEAYEISNFARPGMYSRHNASYWSGDGYVGIGPSAHSFNGRVRSWNVSNNHIYTASLLKENKRPAEDELLDDKDRYNEYVMTRLRTSWGCNAGEIENKFGEVFAGIFLTELHKIDSDHYHISEGRVTLTPLGRCFADRIAAALFVSK